MATALHGFRTDAALAASNSAQRAGGGPQQGRRRPQGEGATAAPDGGIQGRRRPPRGDSDAPPEIRRWWFKGQERVPNRNPVPSFFLGQTGPFL